jgi:hypothetical protein
MSLWTATDNNAGKPKFDAGADVFGVDTTEISAGSDNVVSISVNSAGTGYASAPAVTVAGNTTSTASVASGKVTALSVTGTNTGHSTAPAVTIAAPAAKQFNGASNVGSNAITESSHGFATGDALTYAHSGGTVVGGLVNGTTYYAVNLTANTLSLATTVDNANATTPVVITLTDGSGGNHTLTGTTATGSAALGTGNYTHAGWVKRTVGTGGRAGRVHYETLVAMSSISGDASDDTEFPDA